MHKVEIRLTHEGNDPANVFELYNESYKDGVYVEGAPKQEVSGGGAAIVMFLDVDSRLIIVAKGNKGQLVFDKEQNANVRVETEAEQKERADREAKIAESQAQQRVTVAQAAVAGAKESAGNAEHAANAELRKAEANAAAIKADQAKNLATASEQKPAVGTADTTAPKTVVSPTPPVHSPGSLAPAGTRPGQPGNPASANTGPIDSKQIKAERDAPASSSKK